MGQKCEQSISNMFSLLIDLEVLENFRYQLSTCPTCLAECVVDFKVLMDTLR